MPVKTPPQAPAGFPRAPVAPRRERLGEWAVVVVLALALGLWLCWPAGNYHPRAPTLLPEPTAAYVQVVFAGNALASHPDRLAHPTQAGTLPAPALPLLAPVPPPALPPPPPYAELAAEPLAPPPVAPPEPAWTLLPLAGCPTPPPPPPPPVRGLRVRRSPGLAAAGYRLEQADLPADGTGRRFYRVTLNADGRVAALLDESAETEGPAARACRRVVLSGAGTNSAAGTVTLEWL